MTDANGFCINLQYIMYTGVKVGQNKLKPSCACSGFTILGSAC